MKIRHFILAILSIVLILIMSACSSNGNNENEAANTEENEANNNDQTNENNDSDSNENEGDNTNDSDQDGDYRSDLGNLEIWFEAEVNVEEDQVTVEGESNLLPGAVINSSGVSEHFPTDAHDDEAEVKEDGSFNFEFPDYEDEVEVTLSLSTLKDEVSEHYGDNLENATGNQVYKTSEPDEYESKYTFIIDPREEKPYTIDLETPDYENNVPSDYGDTDVRMDVEATTKHNFLYFEGESNLVEGTLIKGGINDPEDLVSSAWSSSEARVKPDGSFDLRIHYWDLREGMEMEFDVDPSDSSWDNVIDAYGEEGEKLEGDLVKERDDGEKYVQLAVDLAGPEIDAPDDVGLSLEDEEIKIQVPDDLLFDFDESDLKDDAKDTLDEAIDVLEELDDDEEVQIKGHTDDEGEPDYNMDLSEDRASAVEEYMTDNGDIDHLSIETEGYGEEEPIASNEDEDGREKNRRVEIIFDEKE